MNTKACSIAVLLFMLGSNASAQDACSVLISEASHDVDLEEIMKAANDAQHKMDCRSSSSQKGLSIGGNVGAYGVTVGSTKASSSQSCAEDSSSSANDSASMKYARSVVREAYAAVIACKELEAGQVSAKFEILPRAVVVSMKRMNDPVTFNGVTVVPSSAMHCTRKNPDGGASIEVTDTTPIPLPDSTTLTVTCTRTDTDPGEEILFEAADLIVETSRKAGRVSLDSNRYPATTSTRDLLAKIDTLQQALDASAIATEQRLSPLETFATELSNLKSPHTDAVTISVENNDWWNGRCPDKHVSTGHVLTTYGRGGPVNFIRLKCAPLPVFPPKAADNAGQQATSS